MGNTNEFNEVCGNCLNCEKCSGDNADGRYKYLNNKWKMNCRKCTSK